MLEVAVVALGRVDVGVAELLLHEDQRLAGAAIAKHSRRGWRIDKAGRADSIDAVVALAMALDSRERAPEPVRLLGWL